MTSLRRVAERQLALWREDPIRFMTEELHFDELDDFQVDFFRALGSDRPEHQRIAQKASKGPGKTFNLAGAGWWFLSTQGDRGDHPNGIAISSSADNLRGNLWKELAKHQMRSEYLKSAFTFSKTRIFANDHPDTWWLDARNWSKTASTQEQSDTLAGLHSGFVLVLMDESGGTPPAILATAEAALATCRWGKILQGGNTTSLEGALYQACAKQRHLWYVITVNGDPDSPTRAKRVSKLWAQQQIDAYGRDNPWVLVNVFGEFPPSSLNTLLGLEDVEKAMRRYGAIQENDYSYAQKRIGCDVHRFGDDRDVFFPRQGSVAHMPVVMRQQRGHEMAARISLMIKRWGGNVLVLVDSTGGYGYTLEDALHVAHMPFIPLDFGGKAIDTHFENKRAEMWWEMAEWIKHIGAIPPELNEIVAELTNTHYTHTKKGKLILEPKDIVKSAIGRSPDLADALACTFGLPEMSDLSTPEGKILMAAGFANTETEHEWDPLENDT